MTTTLKKYSYKIYVLVCLLCGLIACEDASEDIIEIEANPLKLEISSQLVVLDPENLDKEIMYFTWEPALDKTNEGTIIESYLFKMDLADKSFETAIPTTAIKEGTFYKSFTTRELNDLLFNQWGVPYGSEIGMEARVIAKYVNSDKFVKPAVSTISFKIQSKAIESQPLYLMGSANPAGSDTQAAMEMIEILKGETYTWRGELNTGEYFFIKNRDAEFPSYMMNDAREKNKIVLKESDSDEGVPFVIEQKGMYAITLNLSTLRITCDEVFFIERLSVIGSGTNWGWPSGSATADDPVYGGTMVWSLTDPNVCEIVTDLKSGEMRICVAGKTNVAFRPYNAEAPISQPEHDVVFMYKPDYKWRIQTADAGTYRITLDTKNNKIKIIKQ